MARFFDRLGGGNNHQVPWGLIGQAAGMFAATNVDDLLLLALFFGRAPDRAARARVVAGQYLGFGAILAASVAAALGAALLPEGARPYLGLLPIALGLRAAWSVWRDRHEPDEEPRVGGPGVLAVAAVTLANGGDNVGVYTPVFAAADPGALVVYAAVFLALVAVWCAAGGHLATRPAVARLLSRRGHVLLPAVLIAIGLVVLVGGLRE